jgi:hypothetical protein
LVEVVLQTTPSGHVQWVLLDAHPVTRDTQLPQPDRGPPRQVADDDTVACLVGQGRPVGAAPPDAGTLQYHTAEKIAGKVLAMEAVYQITPQDARHRLAVTVTDGAFVGPGSGYGDGNCKTQQRQLSVFDVLANRQGTPREPDMAQLCDWHACVKVCEHTDRVVDGLVGAYYSLARRIRRIGAFGEGQKVFKAVSAELNVTWLRPIAPQRNGTRTPLYESNRVPPNVIGNFRVAVCGLVLLHQMVLDKERQKAVTAAQARGTSARNIRHGYWSPDANKIRSLGRSLCDLPSLLFTTARREMRLPLLRYANLTQSVSISGFEKTRQQHATVRDMRQVVDALRCARGAVEVSRLLFACAGSRARGANSGLTMASIEAFVMAVVRCTVARTLPGVAVRLVEMVVRKTYQGVPIGYEPAAGSHANRRGWRLGIFDPKPRTKSAARGPRPDLRQCRQELHQDARRVLDRLVHMALREEELFRTRVMYYDSPAPPEARFTPPRNTATVGGKKTTDVTADGGKKTTGKKLGRKSGKRCRGESSESEVSASSSDSASSASPSAGSGDTDEPDTDTPDTDADEDADASQVIGQPTLSDDSTLADVVKHVLSHSDVRDSFWHDTLVDGGARPDERSRPCAEQPRAVAAHNPLPPVGARIQRRRLGG